MNLKDVKSEEITPNIKMDKNYRNQILNYIAIKIPFGLIPGVFSMIYIYFFWDYLGLNQQLYNIGMIIYGIFNATNSPASSSRIWLLKNKTLKLMHSVGHPSTNITTRNQGRKSVNDD